MRACSKLARGRWLVCLLALLPSLGACHSWRTVSGAPRTYIDMERPQLVRATLEGGRTVTLAQPSMLADTIVGMTDLGLGRAPTLELRSLEVQRTSVPKTLALIVTHVAVVVTAIAIIIDVQPHYRGF